jgi:hypothetical protein
MLGVRAAALARHLQDTSQPVFSLDLDQASMAPRAPAAAPLAPKLVEETALKQPPMIERVLVIVEDELERPAMAGLLVAPNRDVEVAADLLAAVRAIKTARVPFDFILVSPPRPPFSLKDLGRQLSRLAPASGLALLDPKADDDVPPFHAVRDRPETTAELTELLALVRKRRKESPSAV